MKFKLFGKAVLACALASSAAGTHAQTGARRGAAKPAPGESEVTRQQQQQQAQGRQRNALQTLVYLKNSASEIDDAQDRVRVLLEIADALWVADREQSRDVFQSAFENAVKYENNLDDKQRKSYGMTLRQRVVARIARRDSALANRLLSASVPKESEPKTPNEAFAKLYGLDSARGDVLVRAASDMLATDKEAAVQLGQLAATEGFTQGLRRFLVALRLKDGNSADAIFETALQAAARRSPKELVEALFIWDYAFQRGDIYLGQVSWLKESGGQQPTPAPPAVKQRALSFAVEAVLENVQQYDMEAATDEQRSLVRERYVLIHSLASQIMPDVERYVPAQLQLLQTHLSRIDQVLREDGRTPPSPPEPLPTDASASEDVDKMLDIASRVTNLKVRDGVYARAALTLYMHHDYDHALEVAQKIDDHSLEAMLTEPIKFDRAGEMLAAKNLEGALAVVRTLEKPEVRVSALARLGAAFFAAKEEARGAEVLNDAETLAGKTDPSVDLAAAVLAIAQSYLTRDRARAVDLTASAIRIENAAGGDEPWELLLAGAGSDGRLSAQNLNWVTGRSGIVTSVSVTYPKPAGLLDLISKLSASDLDDGLVLARQLKWKSVSFAAQAVVCREALEGARKNKGAQNRGQGRAE
jgi:hypothetical protein